MADDSAIFVIAIVIIIIGALYFAMAPSQTNYTVNITGTNAQGVVFQAQIPLNQYLSAQSAAGIPAGSNVNYVFDYSQIGRTKTSICC